MDDDERGSLDEKISADVDVPAKALSEADQALVDRYASTFIGSFAHSLDGKGRIIVPLPFRADLGKTFYIGPSFDFRSIALYPNLVWAQLRDGYAQMGRYNKNLNRYLEQFDAMSYRDQECDGQGRVLLPSRIRQRVLGDEKDVEITGANDHVRIVARPAGEEQFAAFMDDLPDMLDDISSLMQEASGSCGEKE